MYWYGHIAIDPSHMTHIRKKPSKGFRRFAEVLSAGALTEKEEVETFSAMSILQEINMVMRSIGVTDLVRFSKDDQVIYEDPDSQNTDDMEMLMEQIERSASTLGGSMFDSMTLMLEHHLDEIALVIEVRIIRSHAVGLYPIQIVVNGLAVDFQGDAESLQQKFTSTFSEQANYNAFTQNIRAKFDGFMNRLELAVRQKMQIDDLHKDVRAKIIRPTNTDTLSNNTNNRDSDHYDPVFDRYDSTSDMFFYCWMWSSFMHSHHTHVEDVTLVDEQGGMLATIDENGLDAGAASVFDPDVPFNQSDASELDALHEPVAEVDSKSWWFGGEDSESSSWLSGFGFGDSDGGGFDGGGDSGCSSCGGGCGGD